MQPAIVSSDVATPATVEGRHFYNPVKLALDSDRPASIARGWHVWVAEVGFERDDILLVDSSALAITLPAGLPLGTHDLSVTDPQGQTKTLVDAITVTSSSPADGTAGAPGDGSPPPPTPEGEAGTGGDDGSGGSSRTPAAGAAGQGGADSGGGGVAASAGGTTQRSGAAGDAGAGGVISAGVAGAPQDGPQPDGPAIGDGPTNPNNPRPRP